MTNRLAIAIPTYNRVEILKYNLLEIIDELIIHDIPVYISDDSNNDLTKVMVADLQRKYPAFYYYKNNPGLGHDRNCINTILLPKEKYVWYIGDSMIIKKGALAKILALIRNSDYDFISCNAEGRTAFNVEEIKYDNGIEVLEKLGWHLTMTGTTIYNRDRMIDIENLNLKNYKNFPQTAIIFNQFASKKTSLFWINEKLIYGNKNKSSYWLQEVFEVFLVDFKNLIYNLSDYYPISSKDYVVRKHSVSSGIFNYHSFIKYRIAHIYSYEVYYKYKSDFNKYTNLNSILLFLISLFPVWLLKGIYRPIFSLYQLMK